MEFELEELNEETGSGALDLRETGVYDVKLLRVGYSKASTGSIMMSVTVNAGGEYDDTFYQGVIKKADGSKGFEMDRLLTPLASLCGVTALTTGTAMVKAKDGMVEVKTFSMFQEQPIKIAVQKQWSDYHNDWEKKIVKVFTPDGRTATEVKEGVSTAEQIKYFMSDKFKDKGPKGKGKAKEATSDTLDIDADIAF